MSTHDAQSAVFRVSLGLRMGEVTILMDEVGMDEL